MALATLVRAEGSTYRAVGARLLLSGDGSYVGSVSGGCLEAEIVRKAAWFTREGATVKRYSTAFDDPADIPYGLGCGGTVEVLLEPANTPEFAALMGALGASLGGERRSVKTALPSSGKAFAREVRGPEDDLIFRSSNGVPQASQLLYAEMLVPPQRLFLFGAGEDVRPMVRFASLLGWSVVVQDGRGLGAVSASKADHRFPEAEIVIASPELGRVRPGAGDAVVLMTHSYEADRAWLQQVLRCEPRYVGLLGSRHRSALLVSEAAAALGWSLDRACEHLFAPVGLDLGGDGAEAIALSAVAEIQACTQGKLPHSRRMTPAGVAAQIERGGASLYLGAQCAQ